VACRRSASIRAPCPIPLTGRRPARLQLSTYARVAARPARGWTSPNASAVWFDDVAEMLSCFLRIGNWLGRWARCVLVVEDVCWCLPTGSGATLD